MKKLEANELRMIEAGGNPFTILGYEPTVFIDNWDNDNIIEWLAEGFNLNFHSGFGTLCMKFAAGIAKLFDYGPFPFFLMTGISYDGLGGGFDFDFSGLFNTTD